MARSASNALYIGVGGHAVAIDPTTGSEIWRTKLKSSSFVTVYQSGSFLYAGAGGWLFCLDAATGSIVWTNKLKGLGMGLVAFTSGSEAASQAALEAQRAAAVAVIAAG